VKSPIFRTLANPIPVPFLWAPFLQESVGHDAILTGCHIAAINVPCTVLWPWTTKMYILLDHVIATLDY
jgi:hypothetical protein